MKFYKKKKSIVHQRIYNFKLPLTGWFLLFSSIFNIKQNIILYFVDFENLLSSKSKVHKTRTSLIKQAAMMYFTRKIQQTLQSLSTLGIFSFSGHHAFTSRRIRTANGVLGKLIVTSDTSDLGSSFCSLRSDNTKNLSTAAKPFKEMPGPNPLPFIWNIWRYFPFIGKFLYNAQLSMSSKKVYFYVF